MIIYLIVLFAITLVYLAAAERLIIYSRLIAMQGLLLCGIAIFELREVNTANLVFIVAESFLFKTLLMPNLLIRIIRRSGVYKVHNQAMPGFYLLILSIFASPSKRDLANSLINPFINTIYMVIALYSLFTGLLLIVTHRLIISHLIGFLIIENAVFIFSLAVGSEMPMLINIGILLDIFVGVLILGFFGLRLRAHTSELTKLKD